MRALLGLELYDQAIDELHYAQKVWGDSSAIQATLGWIYHERGDLRAGINAMKRAYPQYLAAGGEKLPAELLKVLFPVDYWPLIRRYAAEHQLDPYVVAALIAQESTFAADVKSAANAYGLMQLLPSTGRQYARTLQPAERFSLGMLTTAEAEHPDGHGVLRRSGQAVRRRALRAGQLQRRRRTASRGGLPSGRASTRDEFIDDIPFPETQNYVKKILGTAEDYRRLYGPATPRAPTRRRGADATPARGDRRQPRGAEERRRRRRSRPAPKKAGRRRRKPRKKTG